MIWITTLPDLVWDEQKWLNTIITKYNAKLIAVTIHSISNKITYYFEIQ